MDVAVRQGDNRAARSHGYQDPALLMNAMTLDDPIAAYNAANNLEAHLICGILNEAGVEAVAIEDVSQVGTWMGGLLPQIHRPQVWINRADMDRAKPILKDYMARAAERRKVDETGSPVDVVCEECGQQSSFPAAQKGTVQVCSHCHAFVDVGDEVPFDGWDEKSDESDEDEPSPE